MEKCVQSLQQQWDFHEDICFHVMVFIFYGYETLRKLANQPNPLRQRDRVRLMRILNVCGEQIQTKKTQYLETCHACNKTKGMTYPMYTGGNCARMCCPHHLCFECTFNMLRRNVDCKNTNIKCPTSGCRNILAHEDIYRLLVWISNTNLSEKWRTLMSNVETDVSWSSIHSDHIPFPQNKKDLTETSLERFMGSLHHGIQMLSNTEGMSQSIREYAMEEFETIEKSKLDVPVVYSCMQRLLQRLEMEGPVTPQMENLWCLGPIEKIENKYDPSWCIFHHSPSLMIVTLLDILKDNLRNINVLTVYCFNEEALDIRYILDDIEKIRRICVVDIRIIDPEDDCTYAQWCNNVLICIGPI